MKRDRFFSPIRPFDLKITFDIFFKQKKTQNFFYSGKKIALNKRQQQMMRYKKTSNTQYIYEKLSVKA